MRREEADHVLVVEREPGGAEALRVRSEIGASACEPRFQVREPVAAMAGGFGQLGGRGREVDDHRRVAAERLLQTEIRRAVAEVAGGEKLEGVRRGTIDVRAGGDVIDRVDDQIEVDQAGRRVGLEVARRGPQGGPELLRRERRVSEPTGRSATLDRLAEPAPRSPARPRPRDGARTNLIRELYPFPRARTSWINDAG